MIYCSLDEAFDKNEYPKSAYNFDTYVKNNDNSQDSEESKYKSDLKCNTEYHNPCSEKKDYGSNYFNFKLKKHKPCKNTVDRPIINNAPIINAQGDIDENHFISDRSNYPNSLLSGTHISDISEYSDASDSDSETCTSGASTDYSFFDYKSESDKNVKQKKMSHAYCINSMCRALSKQDSSEESLYSSATSDNLVYKHVKNCDYCKKKINEIMSEEVNRKEDKLKENLKVKEGFSRKNYKDNKMNYEDNKINYGENKINYFENLQFGKSIGYSMKEIIIMVLASVFLVMIIDTLVKINQNNN